MSQTKLMLIPVLLFTLGSAAQAEPPRNISFNNVKFEMEKGTPFERKMLTPEIEKLVGKKIRIRGWILPAGKRRA